MGGCHVSLGVGVRRKVRRDSYQLAEIVFQLRPRNKLGDIVLDFLTFRCNDRFEISLCRLFRRFSFLWWILL